MIHQRDLLHVFWIFAMLLFLKFFVVEPFRIPTGSMIPSVLVGDHLFVAKAAYDISLPFGNVKLIRIAEPRRSEVIVFEYPNHEKDPRKEGYFYIKRLVGLPGDRIAIRDGVPVINGEAAELEEVALDDPRAQSILGFKAPSHAKLYRERLPGAAESHWVQRYGVAMERYRDDLLLFRRQMGRDCLNLAEGLSNPSANFYRSVAVNSVCEFEVPPDHYFVMGDNRDDSEDGRLWGFVERKLLRGKALSIWLSRDESHASSRYFNWSRLGQAIK